MRSILVKLTLYVVVLFVVKTTFAMGIDRQEGDPYFGKTNHTVLTKKSERLSMGLVAWEGFKLWFGLDCIGAGSKAVIAIPRPWSRHAPFGTATKVKIGASLATVTIAAIDIGLGTLITRSAVENTAHELHNIQRRNKNSQQSS